MAPPLRQFIQTINAGGLPLHTRIANGAAGTMGLQMSPRARMDDTIARIRTAVQRLPP